MWLTLVSTRHKRNTENLESCSKLQKDEPSDFHIITVYTDLCTAYSKEYIYMVEIAYTFKFLSLFGPINLLLIIMKIQENAFNYNYNNCKSTSIC